MAQGIDPVGNGYVESLARPGGNITGFIQFEYSLAGKWMELLKEVAPAVTRVGVLREPGNAAIGQWAMIQAVAQSFGAELRRIDLRDASEVERAVSAFAHSPNAGLIVAVSAASFTHRDLIIRLAAQHRLPAVYAYRVFVTHGGACDRADVIRLCVCCARTASGQAAAAPPSSVMNARRLIHPPAIN
jgi:putative ABC transport system substrate-binding protein